MTDRAGRDSLHYAAVDGDEGAVRHLLATGVDVNARDANGFTPLHLVSQMWFPSIVSALLESGADPNAQNKPDAQGALHIAVLKDAGRGGDVIRLLLGAGADPDLPNRSGVTPRSLAEGIANVDLVPHFDGY